MERLKGKVALVTGAARGMGASHVRKLISEGAKVYFTDIRLEEGESLGKELGEKAIFLKQDVSSEDDWKSVTQFICQDEEKLDILVNNAGIVTNGMIGEVTLADYMKTIHVNQVSVFLGLTYCLPLLKKGTNASVVNISSLTGLKGVIEACGSYSSSKFAVRGLTKVAAMEFARHDIRVNSIHPGFINTPILDFEAAEEMMNRLVINIPMERLGTPEEVSKLVVFLCSSESSYCTGAEFVIDGGFMAV